MRSVSVGRRPAMTSSSSNSFGSVARARATSRRLRSGRVSEEANAARLSARSSASRTARAWVRADRVSVRRSSAPTSTLSSTESPGNGLTIWKVRPMPRRHTASGVNPSMRTPANVTVPSSGARAPAIMANRVVLPAPLGPITAKISPAATSKLTWSTATRPRNRLLRSAAESSAVTAIGS